MGKSLSPMGKIVSVTAPNKVEFHSWNLLLLFQNNFNGYKPEEWLCESGNLLTTSLNNYFINSIIPQNNNTPKSTVSWRMSEAN